MESMNLLFLMVIMPAASLSIAGASALSPVGLLTLLLVNVTSSKVMLPLLRIFPFEVALEAITKSVIKVTFLKVRLQFAATVNSLARLVLLIV